MEIEERVKHYWTVRSHDFGAIRKNELEGDMGRRWLEELEQWLPKGKTLDIQDVGTGTGFFAILLAGMGHRVTSKYNRICSSNCSYPDKTTST